MTSTMPQELVRELEAELGREKMLEERIEEAWLTFIKEKEKNRAA
ncbi:hypothetical protein ACOBQJ_12015 [Pelotomaculum propionicicum]